MFVLLRIISAFLLSMGALLGSDDILKREKQSLLYFLQNTNEETLWDIFLEVQADLFFDREIQWLINNSGWIEAEKILEVGSGNGAYLSRLARNDPSKIYEGLEKEQRFVQKAQQKFNTDNISFFEGDAEVFNPEKVNSFDVVLFRLTLQHLNNPRKALKNAWKYLKSNGHIVIIDSYDPARKTSHPVHCIEKALEQMSALQKKKSAQGNRRITIELLNDISDPEKDLRNLYSLAESNLDINGKILYETILFSGEEDRKKLYSHMLFFLAIVQKKYNISTDWEKAYKEIRGYYDDKDAWLSPGLHFLVLKKINSAIVE